MRKDNLEWLKIFSIFSLEGGILLIFAALSHDYLHTDLRTIAITFMFCGLFVEFDKWVRIQYGNN